MITLAATDIDAVILDLDGVVTRTAQVHAKAWKAAFDECRDGWLGPTFEPFDVDADYRRHVDGRPRYEGAAQFLASRGLTVPMGDAADRPGAHTISGIANRKNQLFGEMIANGGVPVFDDAIALIARLKAAGFCVGLVTASRNCAMILQRASMNETFDIVVDGVEAARLGLRGKPMPDSFVAAAQALGVDADHCAVIEDASAGIKAARAGGFRLAIGVQRDRSNGRLDQAGADVVIDNLSSIEVTPLPNALTALEQIAGRHAQGRCAIFLDYDGTLTPIVARPEDAKLAPAVRTELATLATLCPVSVVSGRPLAQLRALVGLDINYAGSHGLELHLLGGQPTSVAEVQPALPAIRAIGEQATSNLAHVPGVLIERKPYSVAIHDRLVAEPDRARVKAEVDRLQRHHTGVRLLTGKRVHEFRPDIEWDKGQAVLTLAEQLGIETSGIIYVGDDATDEDVFRMIRDRGVGIKVGARPRPTAATYRLAEPAAVALFLRRLIETWSGNGQQLDA